MPNIALTDKASSDLDSIHEYYESRLGSAAANAALLQIIEELEQLEYSVDVLGEAEYIDSLSQLNVKEYGVIVSADSRRGLLLPDLDGVDSVEEQVHIARQKAGIRDDEPVKLQRFKVTRHY